MHHGIKVAPAKFLFCIFANVSSVFEKSNGRVKHQGNHFSLINLINSLSGLSVLRVISTIESESELSSIELFF